MRLLNTGYQRIMEIYEWFCENLDAETVKHWPRIFCRALEAECRNRLLPLSTSCSLADIVGITFYWQDFAVEMTADGWLKVSRPPNVTLDKVDLDQDPRALYLEFRRRIADILAQR